MNDDRFDRAFRAWAARPPRTHAPLAARRLADRLTSSPSSMSLPLHRLAAAAAILAVLAGGLWLGSRPQLTPRMEPVPADEGVVQLWLDAETPLYLTLTPPAGAEKGTPL